VPVGSTLIDFHMARHIRERLELIKDYLEGDITLLAEEMLTGTFQTVKHSFPNPVVEQFNLDVKGLAGSHTFPEARITNSRMAIDREVLKDIFDQQLNQIFALVDDRLLAVEAAYPYAQVSYIILSGGLGSSPYLYQEIQRRYEMNFGFNSSNTAGIRTMRVLEPCVLIRLIFVSLVTDELQATCCRARTSSRTYTATGSGHVRWNRGLHHQTLSQQLWHRRSRSLRRIKAQGHAHSGGPA
jgi:hypothetical protein